jgi:hypothetical protein
MFAASEDEGLLAMSGAGGTQEPTCLSPPRPNATRGPGARPETLVDGCPGEGSFRGDSLPLYTSGILDLAQDTTSLYAGNRWNLFRVAKSDGKAQQLFPNKAVEAFVFDGTFIYASVTDATHDELFALVTPATRRQLIRVKPDGTAPSVLADLPVDRARGPLRVEAMGVANGALYYVMSDDGLYRRPL